MTDALDLTPRWWREEVSALTDVDAGLLVDGHCARCQRRRGIRFVDGDDTPTAHRWCTRCLLLDMPLRPRERSSTYPLVQRIAERRALRAASAARRATSGSTSS